MLINLTCIARSLSLVVVMLVTQCCAPAWIWCEDAVGRRGSRDRVVPGLTIGDGGATGWFQCQAELCGPLVIVGGGWVGRLFCTDGGDDDVCNLLV